MTRKLGGLERVFYEQSLQGSVNFCIALLVEGDLPKPRIKTALEKLLRAYPFLASRLGEKISYHDNPIPYSVIDRRDDVHWRELAEQEILRHYTDDVCHFTFLPGKPRSEILLSFHHALLDGLSSLPIARTFWKLLHGLPIEMQAQVLSPAVEQGFPKQYQKWSLGSFAAFGRRVRMGPGRAAPLGKDRDTIRTQSAALNFDPGWVQEMQAEVKHQGTNPFAFFCAAILKTASRRLEGGSDTPIGLNVPINMRPYIKPQVSDFGMLISFLVSWHKTEIDFWDLARAIFQSLRADIEQGEAYYHNLHCTFPNILQRFNTRPHISISNLGVIEAFDELPHSRVHSFHAMVALWPKDPLTVVMYSFQGRLTLEVLSSLEKLGPGAADVVVSELEELVFQKIPLVKN